MSWYGENGEMHRIDEPTADEMRLHREEGKRLDASAEAQRTIANMEMDQRALAMHPMYTPTEAEQLAAELSANVSAQISRAMFAHLPRWVKRWERTAPAFVLSLVALWYGVRIIHRRDSDKEGMHLYWDVIVDGHIVETVTL